MAHLILSVPESHVAAADADLDDMANDLGALWGEKVDA